MFSRISRYRTLPDVVVPDVRRGTFASKSLRLLPEVGGTFRHTVRDGERLDNLAFTFYRQPRKWWRICDANPDFLSPLDLLARGPIRTARFGLSVAPGTTPPWAALAERLRAEPGAGHFQFVDEVSITPEPQLIGGQQVTVHVERHELAVVVTYNELVVTVVQLAALIAATGFVADPAEVIGQAGKAITIPPDTGA